MSIGRIILPVIIPLGIVLGISSCNKQAVEVGADWTGNGYSDIFKENEYEPPVEGQTDFQTFFLVENGSLLPSLDYVYIPQRIEWNWNGSAYTATAIRFKRIAPAWAGYIFQTNVGSQLQRTMFQRTASSYNGNFLYGYKWSGEAPISITIAQNVVQYVTVQNGYVLQFGLSEAQSELSANLWRENLTQKLNRGYYTQSDNEQTFANTYSEGYQDGKADGLTQGYREGQNSVSTEATAIMGLFGGIANVPIQILNGLAPMVIWNTPIVYIIVSLMMFALILTLIERVIHGA